MPKEYFVVGTFKASSGRTWWRVSRDENGDLSCTCPGWCRRVAADGSRTCKHVRKVLEREAAYVENQSAKRVGSRGTSSRIDALGRRRIRL
ncbi:MAG: hypothetical protein O7H41_11415 [Planctomycetota bacterium]|nr:hypothetical protein [Planctomycetota bacterium]